LTVAQTADGVVLIKAVVGLCRRLDVPCDQGRIERRRHFIGQNGLACARLTLDEQRALQRDGGIDRDLQFLGGDIVRGALEPVVRPRHGLLR
jgi:hypothetical protein